jgi:hypothetical protein
VRWLLPLLLGCSSSHGTVSADAAPPGPDADSHYCDTGADSAHVTVVTSGTSSVFTSAFAGGTVGGGGILPLTGQPMSVSMMFTTMMHLPVETAQCCDLGGGACCPLDGVVANTTEELLPGSELGSHPVVIRSLQSSTVMVQGTLIVTDFVGPFDQAPGRISGSISTGDNSVSGTFANTFCSALFQYPI